MVKIVLRPADVPVAAALRRLSRSVAVSLAPTSGARGASGTAGGGGGADGDPPHIVTLLFAFVIIEIIAYTL